MTEFNRNEIVTVRETIRMKARKGRSEIILAVPGDRLKVIHETIGHAVPYLVRNSNPEHPPMFRVSATELCHL